MRKILFLSPIVLVSAFALAFGCYHLGSTNAISQWDIEARKERNKLDDNKIRLVWNDDEEAIPAEGELVRIESIDENIVWICAAQ